MKVTKEEILRELAAYPKLARFNMKVLVGIEADNDMVIAFMPNKWSSTIVRPCYKVASKLSEIHDESYAPIVMSEGWFKSYKVDSGFTEYVKEEPTNADDTVVLKCGDDELPLPFNREQFELIAAMSRELWKVFERV